MHTALVTRQLKPCEGHGLRAEVPGMGTSRCALGRYAGTDRVTYGLHCRSRSTARHAGKLVMRIFYVHSATTAFLESASSTSRSGHACCCGINRRFAPAGGPEPAECKAYPITVQFVVPVSNFGHSAGRCQRDSKNDCWPEPSTSLGARNFSVITNSCPEQAPLPRAQKPLMPKQGDPGGPRVSGEVRVEHS